jgi:branched-subunit amino acid transport protein
VYLSVHNNQMWAVLAAGAVFAWKRNMLLMMTVGMAVFTALRLWA